MLPPLLDARLIRRTAPLLIVLLTPLLNALPPASVKSPIPIDFSYAGYEAGGRAIPSVKAVLLVKPSSGDDTALIQGALDRVTIEPIAPVRSRRGAAFDGQRRVGHRSPRPDKWKRYAHTS